MDDAVMRLRATMWARNAIAAARTVFRGIGCIGWVLCVGCAAPARPTTPTLAAPRADGGARLLAHECSDTASAVQFLREQLLMRERIWLQRSGADAGSCVVWRVILTDARSHGFAVPSPTEECDLATNANAVGATLTDAALVIGGRPPSDGSAATDLATTPGVTSLPIACREGRVEIAAGRASLEQAGCRSEPAPGEAAQAAAITALDAMLLLPAFYALSEDRHACERWSIERQEDGHVTLSLSSDHGRVTTTYGFVRLRERCVRFDGPRTVEGDRVLSESMCADLLNVRKGPFGGVTAGDWRIFPTRAACEQQLRAIARPADDGTERCGEL